MRVAVAGHIVIDNIVSGRIDTVTLGGPPSYAGLTAKILGAEVTLLTKYGVDLPEEYQLWLLRNQLQIPRTSLSKTHPTTRFRIVQTGEERELYLKSRCEDITPLVDDLEGDLVIISPVAGEVGGETFKALRKVFSTIYLDPQGLLRRFRADGRCYLEGMDVGLLRDVDIVKVDPEEASRITGGISPYQSLKYLTDLGPKVAIYTMGVEGVLLRCGEGVFNVPVEKGREALDTTGAGDIFAGAFATTYLQGGDAAWSCCVAVAASSMGLDKVGLSKIPDLDSIAVAAGEISRKIGKIDSA